MVGPPVQCSQEDGTCDQMKALFNGFKQRSDPAALDNYRFLLDIDVGLPVYAGFITGRG